ncbi:fatty acid-binding protein, adipocyte-like isoform X2 [Ostrea edulis]|uniref:fatty acid-binding protein, adipocyte-like isoform X2 n=1 Tax=Ostrea edulis TaxID=37623 RepID=UPI0024AF589D|nr:fatty acid-binding protein, adipocyte-like isoform X2 [Ostrea edulis]
MASLVGKWSYVSADNMEKYMEASGVPENLREIARKSQPNMEISNSGDTWTIKTEVGDKVKDSTFKLAEEFDSVSLTGQPLKCTVTLNGEEMTEVQKSGDIVVSITRKIENGQLLSTMTINGVSAVVKFQKA